MIFSFHSPFPLVAELDGWMEHHLEFLSLKGGCAGSFESTLVKMTHYCKSRVMAQIFFITVYESKINDPFGHQVSAGFT